MVTVQWYLFGFSLAFSESSGNPFIGNFDLGAIHSYFDINSTYSLAPTIPSMVFMVYQGMFAAITPVIAYAAAAERLRLFQFFIFVIIWSTVVYDPITYWVFSPNGWLAKLEINDFAGITFSNLINSRWSGSSHSSWNDWFGYGFGNRKS